MNLVTRLRAAMAFIVTAVFTAAFLASGVVAATAACMWAVGSPQATGYDVIRALGVWLASFIVVNLWSLRLWFGSND